MNARVKSHDLVVRPLESQGAGERCDAGQFTHSFYQPRTATICEIEAYMRRPGVELAIQHYRWDQHVESLPFHVDAYYLDLALIRRPVDCEVAYLGTSHRRVFAPSGTCCFVPPGHEMLVRVPESEQRALTCLFDQSLMDPYIDWEWTPLELAACFDINNLNIRAALTRLAEEVACPGFAADVLVDSTVAALLIELSRHFRSVRAVADHVSGKLSARQLRNIEELIDTTNGSFPSVSWIAERCGLSARHLARIFKNTTGKTLGEFIAEVRLARAKRKLGEAGCLVKEVAYDCGFQSQSSFAQAFRRATGMTPLEFRRRARR